MKLKMKDDKFRKARLKLVVFYSFLTLILIFAIETAFFVIYSRTLYNTFDTNLKNRALSIASSLSTYDSKNFEAFISTYSEENIFNEKDEVIQILTTNGKKLYSIGDLSIENIKLIPNDFQTVYTKDIVNNKITNIPVRVFIQPLNFEDGSFFIVVGRTYDSVHEAIKSFLFSILFITPIVFLLILLLAFKIANYTLKPIEESYNTLKQFTEDVSHELKTPLAIIKTNIDVALSKQEFDFQYIKNKLEIINRVTERITDIVTKMSLLSIIDSNNLKLKLEKINLNNFVHEKIEEFSELANRKRIHIDFKADKNVEIVSDIFCLGEIISNLLSNAIKYTNEGGHVTVEIDEEKNKVKLLVSDTGIGISKSDLEHIFDRFYRSDKSRSRDTGGAGLGLAIVKNMVNFLDGTIDVKSAEGKGTTFSITFPKNIKPRI